MGLGSIRQPEFGQRLRQLRERRSLSQRDVADGVVNPSYISLLESGARVPTLEVAVRLAQSLEVPLQELVGSTTPFTEDSGDLAGRLVLDIMTKSALDLGDLDDAEVRFRDAYEAANRDGATVSALEYGIALHEVLVLKSEHQERGRLLADVAVLAEQVGVPEVMVKVAVDRASAARDGGRMSDASELAEKAAEDIKATSFGSTSEHVRALGVLVSIRCESGAVSELPKLIDQMIDIAEKLDRRPVLGRAHWAASVAFARIGEPKQAERHFRYAKEMLATPATPLWEWAKFSRAAASALLDADTEADLAEIEQFMRGAQATLSVVDVPGEASQMQLVEARFALAVGDPAKALELSTREPADLPGSALVRLRITRARALCRLERIEEAVTAFRSAANLCEELDLYRLASQIWREIDEVRSH
ncbi:helix-turn-helix domain-containing protein [Amycolatopsis sp. H20-H5]|uniref:helix-turn-helix domain-containing protein n=1 Tax=Amycolatopsis sp. H20-H5 TaxID=3046309 RepID=UPI002DBA5531|nr:helix-turn-helix domain-containing protein [Amycolatopsis sp. H20-H5]MEC3976392.1 helix-turn-helix domain-containing protein [Amycolatopsis sp. H20-H5]